MSSDETITRIFEKLDRQTDLLHKVDTNVAELKQQYASTSMKIEELEKESTANSTRITKLETSVTLLRNNYKWWCVIFSAIGTLLGFLFSNSKNILALFN